MSKRIDLLNGNIFESLTKLALPIMATSLIQMAYNMTDMIWIGILGSNAVAAVGASGMFLWFSQAAIVLARMGGQVKVAQYLGANDRKNASNYAKSALQLGIFLTVVYSIIMIAWAEQLVGFFKLNSADTIKNAVIYLRLVGGCTFLSAVTQIFTGIITATGNSKTPFVVTTIGLIINIVLDPVLIFVCNMNVAGAALATVIAQGVVAGLFILYAVKDDLIFRNMNIFSAPDFNAFKHIIIIGIPSAVQTAVFSGTGMVIARFIAGFGDAAVAVQKVGSQIESISWMTADGFSMALNSFVAQNYGAKNYHRAQRGYRDAIGIISIWGFISTAILVFIPGPIFKIFIRESSVIPIGINYLVIQGYSQLFMCIEIVTSGAFSGYGKTLPPSIVGVVLTAMRIPLVVLLSRGALGLDGVWWSITISSILKGVVLLVWYIIFINHKFKGSLAEEYNI